MFGKLTANIKEFHHEYGLSICQCWFASGYILDTEIFSTRILDHLKNILSPFGIFIVGF